MSQEATIRAKTDAWVEHDSPNANHGSSAKLRLRSDDTGHGRQAFVHFKRPFPKDRQIIQALLRVYRKEDWSASHPILVRRVTESWKEDRATWGNKPGTDAPSEVTFTAPAGSDGDLFEIDVTALCQDWADGDDCHGFRLVLGDDESHAIYATESPKDGTTPKLYAEWTQAPYPPSNLSPAGGDAVSVASPRLNYRFTDHSGKSSKQGSVQVQVFTDPGDPVGSMLFDSGKVAHTRSSYPLAGHYALAEGDVVWWRVKVWDTADFASGWSNAAQFVRTAKGDVTILSPPASPANIVDDLTPVVLFSYTGGGVLKRVRLILSEVKPSGELKRLYEFKDQTVDPTFNAITLEKRRAGKVRSLIQSGKTYRIQIFAHDDVDRAQTAGDPTFAYAQRDFTYQRAGVPDPILTLTAVAEAAGQAYTKGRPKVHLTFTCATAPDAFCLVVDGVEVLPRIDPADVATLTAGQYEMDFWGAIDGELSTYEVERVVTNVGSGSRQHSAGNPTDDATVDVRGKWLVDEDDSLAVQITNAEQVDLELGESGDTKFPVGSRRPFRVTDGVRGNEGSAAGVVRSEAEKDDFLALKGRMKELRYLQGKLNVPVVLGQAGAPPRSATSEKDWWLVSTEMFQVDEFFDVVGR